MLFHVADQSQNDLPPSKREYKVSPTRLIGAFAFVIFLFAVACAAHAYNWNAGEEKLLTMAQSVFGIAVGILYGEANASKQLKDQGS
jgi:hypothetical protein